MKLKLVLGLVQFKIKNWVLTRLSDLEDEGLFIVDVSGDLVQFGEKKNNPDRLQSWKTQGIFAMALP